MNEKGLAFKLDQLRSLCAVIQEGLSVSRAARALGLSQPAVSKQIKALEAELGVDLLIRTGNRVVGLTDAGRAIQDAARRTVLEADHLAQLTNEFTRKKDSQFVIATTHINARYVLRPYIKRFVERYPSVQLVIRQGTPAMIAGWILLGQAQIGISARPDENDSISSDLAQIPCFEWYQSIMVPVGHPILENKKLTIDAVASFPIITLDPNSVSGRTVTHAFQSAGLTANFVLTALDADVAKTYVELGLGIGVLPAPSYEPDRDTALVARDASSLFAPTITYLELRRGAFLRDYILDFASWLSPAITQETITSAVKSPARIRSGGTG